LRLNILKKLRTASLNSEFTGSYKKVYHFSKYRYLILKAGINLVVFCVSASVV